MATNNQKARTQLLVSRFCAGDDKAYAELYDMYVQMLYNYGLKLTSDQELLKDCIHDVFVKVYAKRHEKNAIKNFCSYLIISLKNRLLDEFRRQAFSTPNEVESYEYRQAVCTGSPPDAEPHPPPAPGHHTLLLGRTQVRRDL